MKSRKWIGTVLITLVIVSVLAAGGYALYRFGYSRGVLATHMGEGFMLHDFDDMPFLPGQMRRFAGESQEEQLQQYRDLPYHRFDPRAAPFERMLVSHTSFSPLSILLRVLFLGLVGWAIYKIITLFSGGKNWQLSFTSQSGGDPEPEEKPKGRGRAK